jgi:hypothetical protein
MIQRPYSNPLSILIRLLYAFLKKQVDIQSLKANMGGKAVIIVAVQLIMVRIGLE